MLYCIPTDTSFEQKGCYRANPETRTINHFRLALLCPHVETSSGASEKTLLLPHSAKLVASGRVWLLLCHEHTDHLTHWLSSALMTDARTHIHTRMPDSTVGAPQICTHTYMRLYPHPPPGLIHLLHLRMRLLWCHPQCYHFKGTKALQCHQRKE